MRIRRLTGSIFWFMIGIYVAIHSYLLGLGSFNHPGPGLIFFLSALLLIILSAIDVAGFFFIRPRTGKETDERVAWSGVRWQKVLLVFGALSTYLYLFNVAGFLMSTLLLMVFLFRIERASWWFSIAGGSIILLISYGIFEVWLGVPFPVGFMGF